MDVGATLLKLWNDSGFNAFFIGDGWKSLVMIVVACVLLYLGIVKKFEPLLLVGIAFGALLTNLPGNGLYHPELWDAFLQEGNPAYHSYGTILANGGLLDILYIGVKAGVYPSLIFMGIGAMTDFGPLLSNPKSLLLGAAAQLGVFVAFFGAVLLGFTGNQAASIGIIGGADGPTAILLTTLLAPELLGAIAIAAYSYMALIPMIQPPIMRLLTSEKDRAIKMEMTREVSKTEKIVFPIVVSIFIILLLLPLVPFFFSGLNPSASVRAPGTCLGLPILQKDVTVSDTPPPQVLYQGQPAAFDRVSKTLYLPVSLTHENMQPEHLSGTLRAADSGVSLAFLPDAAFENLADAISSGHAFRLIASQNGTHSVLSVIFTTLPVICMDTASDSDYSDPYAEHYGSIRTFDPDGTNMTDANWHRRGMSTLRFKKGSWKLSVTNRLGRPRNVSIAGLGSDDDWILNSMGMDDLKLREMFVTRLWNQMKQDKGSTLRMADCAYCEVILDGEYMGLYLLQRRVDSKFLALEKSRDIVLKGGNYQGPTHAAEAFSVKSSPMEERKTQMLVQPLFELSDVSNIRLDTWLDTNAFVLFGSMADNLWIRNCYYILSPQASGYSISFLPWDTDLSFGIENIPAHGFTLLPLEESSFPIDHRREYEALLALYPDLDAQISAHWQKLRNGIFSEANISAALASITNELESSGAYERDLTLWGQRYGGQDTVLRMQDFISLRFRQLDAVYMK